MPGLREQTWRSFGLLFRELAVYIHDGSYDAFNEIASHGQLSNFPTPDVKIIGAVFEAIEATGRQNLEINFKWRLCCATSVRRRLIGIVCEDPYRRNFDLAELTFFRTGLYLGSTWGRLSPSYSPMQDFSLALGFIDVECATRLGSRLWRLYLDYEEVELPATNLAQLKGQEIIHKAFIALLSDSRSKEGEFMVNSIDSRKANGVAEGWIEWQGGHGWVRVKTSREALAAVSWEQIGGMKLF
ncbi:hypothetical protein K469DRAFT_681939 [Zopfia rhizophila CBS 207.26]|uniref:Uncharacterized protein n=1 Tax=Zopfia rhizophila CBS 207.26 TaxID=1314779 RepID=A0A6A6EZW5_9PEZI|nr:hypothetical protein K469DRAFT_681939 [Zopfia rhizophila CBS 207.26]